MAKRKIVRNCQTGLKLRDEVSNFAIVSETVHKESRDIRPWGNRTMAADVQVQHIRRCICAAAAVTAAAAAAAPAYREHVVRRDDWR